MSCDSNASAAIRAGELLQWVVAGDPLADMTLIPVTLDLTRHVRSGGVDTVTSLSLSGVLGGVGNTWRVFNETAAYTIANFPPGSEWDVSINVNGEVIDDVTIFVSGLPTLLTPPVAPTNTKLEEIGYRFGSCGTGDRWRLYKTVADYEAVPPSPPPPPSGGGTDKTSYTAENKSGVSVGIGVPVFTHTSGSGFSLAQATGTGNPCVGLTTTASGAGFAATIQTAGVVVATNWSAVTGTTLLSPRSRYFLSAAVAGGLTVTPPSVSGQSVQLVGVAVSTTELALEIMKPVLL